MATSAPHPGQRTQNVSTHCHQQHPGACDQHADGEHVDMGAWNGRDGPGSRPPSDRRKSAGFGQDDWQLTDAQ
ncbi:hypothetical protein GN956_G12874 [Arapaima gigas]